MGLRQLAAPRVERAAAKAPLFAGVDLGGTNIKMGIVDSNGLTVAAHKFRTEGELGPVAAMQRTADQLTWLCEQTQIPSQEIVRVGLATPGTMDIPAGMILEPPNLPANWRNFAIRDCLAQAVGKKVSYENDANAAALGEFWVGTGEEYNSIVLLTLGTGVGAGIIIDGVPLDGAHSHGGECGHIIVDSSTDARPCGCGQRGHLEAYCSATALVKRASEELAAGRTSTLASLPSDGQLSARKLAEAAGDGDELALELITELATHLGRGLVTIAHTVDPAAIILGGAMNFGGPHTNQGIRFLAQATQTFQQLAFPVLARRINIAFAQLGGDAGFVGAAGTARRDYLAG